MIKSGKVQTRVRKRRPNRPRVGDVYPDRRYLKGAAREQLSAQYFRDNAHRPPLVVVTPTGTPFLVDSRGWTCEGAWDELTVKPSIHEHGRWHGFLTKGVLDDA